MKDAREAISGNVTLDGQPLASGDIRFEPQQPSAAQASGAMIEQGQFRLDRGQGLLPGSYRVAISSPKGDPAAAPSMDNHGPVEDLIPERYNLNSELTITVVSPGPNQFDFKLDSKPLPME